METKKQWVDARFGDNWINHTKEQYDIDTICELALKNGRKAIILQDILNEVYKVHPELKQLVDDKLNVYGLK